MKSLGEIWLSAASDLGLKVTVPFEFVANDGCSFMFEAAVHEFGGKAGMLLMQQWDAAKAQAAANNGYGYSCMQVGGYDRSSTIEVLQDWGWSGAGLAPAWLEARN